MADDKGTSGNEAAGHNKWDAVIALIVVGGLIVLVVFLVIEYGSDFQKVTSVLGVAAPVLAAAFGVSLGYYTGNKAGHSAGEESAKAEVRSRLEPVVGRLEDHVGRRILSSISTQFASPSGTSHYVGTSDRGEQIEIPGEEMTGARQAISDIRGIVESL